MTAMEVGLIAVGTGAILFVVATVKTLRWAAMRPRYKRNGGSNGDS